MGVGGGLVDMEEGGLGGGGLGGGGLTDLGGEGGEGGGVVAPVRKVEMFKVGPLSLRSVELHWRIFFWFLAKGLFTNYVSGQRGGGGKCRQWLTKGGGGGRQMLTMHDEGGRGG